MTTKRVALVLGLTCLSVLLFAGTAFGLAGTGSSGPSDPYAVNPGGTPHMGYASTTVKCAVCHAVHRGPVVGEVLLRDTVADACVFCHIEANVSSVKVYNLVEASYTADNVYNHGAAGGLSECVDCHAVHGAQSITSTQGGINTKILKASTGTLAGGNAGVPAEWDFATGTDYNGIESKFCTQCHNYWTAEYDDALTDTNHIMTPALDDLLYGNTKTAMGVVGTTAVAYAPSTYCVSCHDDGANTSANNFPHLTLGARFLKSADSTADATFVGAADPSEDGACLKCHRNGTTGTGIGY